MAARLNISHAVIPWISHTWLARVTRLTISDVVIPRLSVSFKA